MKRLILALCFLLIGSSCWGSSNFVSIVRGPAAAPAGDITLNTGSSLGDPIAAYILEDSTTTGTGTAILDLTVNNRDLTLSGGYTRESTGGITFNGTSGTAVGSYSSVNDYPLTIVATFKSATTPMWVLNLCKSTTTNNIVSLSTRTETTIKPAIVVFPASFNEDLGTTTLTSGNTYTMVVVLTSATDRKIYLDGVLEASFTTSITFPTGGVDNISIGSLADSTPSYGAGTIIGAYLYDYALSQAQAESLSGSPWQIINNYTGPR